MYRKPSEVSTEEWTKGYQLWLRGGYTLEKVGRALGLRPNSGRSVSNYLRRLYGDGATDPIANSFIRSMASDYPDNSWVSTLKPCDNRGSGRFMSLQKERKMTPKGTAKVVGNRSNEMKYRIAYQQSLQQSYDPWSQFDTEPKPLVLSQFLVITQVVVSLLEGILRTDEDELQSNVATAR